MDHRRKMLVAIAMLLGGGTAGLAVASPYAQTVVNSVGLDATGAFDDPAALLGAPTRTFTGFDFARLSDTDNVFETSIVYPSFVSGTLTTIAFGDSVTLKMGQDVVDDPGNPFGIDLLVYGNGFFTASQPINDAADMDSVTLDGSGQFEGNVAVSVSPDNVTWHTFTSGPFGDGLLPTQAYAWDSTADAWDTNAPTDFERPADPSLTHADFAGLTVTQALSLYGESGGGTGFDLADTPFQSIRYVRFEGLDPAITLEPDPGEIDAVVDVRADIAGDTDRDGDVDPIDLQTLADNWGQTPRAWEAGDFNADEVVDALDLDLMRLNWLVGASGSSPQPSFAEALASVTVPEPAGLAVLGPMARLLLRRSRGRGR